MATTTRSLQNPCHEHPLVQLELSQEQIAQRCYLCGRKIWTKAYTCQEGCEGYFYHEACVEAPTQIENHPLHPVHPLTLIHDQLPFQCGACAELFEFNGSSFWCHLCEFYLDICCALSTLSDVGGYRGGKTSERITLPLHPHTLTSFSIRHDFVSDSDCNICRGNVEEDGYLCLRGLCEFVIHKRCIQDLYYADGTKAPRVYHGHPLEIFVGEDTGGSSICATCESDKSGEIMGCESCDVFYHRGCFQVPEILRYPPHNPDHTLVLFPDVGPRKCQSCSRFLNNEIYYRCTSCNFFLDVGCASQVLAYCEEGMSPKIELSWHKHPLLLCHQTDSALNDCFYCGDKPIGPTYVCKEKGCGFLFHKRCTEIESTITHPHHPEHPLTLCLRDGDDTHCNACGKACCGYMFSCERCLFYIDVKCTARFPTHKHYLHEHKLLRLEEYRYFQCNRCSRTTNSPLFRCVPCDFSLHEECMELPQVLESKIHWHPLTLYETFVEDDSGEYYCEHCEKTRDPRLGAYVCRQCRISLPRIYHIGCALPELGKVNEKTSLPPAVEKLREQIADKKDEVRSIKEKLEEAVQELDQLEMKYNILLEGDENLKRIFPL